MQPQDKKLIYQVYNSNNRTIAFVSFSLEQFDQMPFFRSRLHDAVKTATELQYRIDTGLYEDIDVNIRYFDSKDADIVNNFYSRPWPGCFSWLFRTRYYREHKSEEIKVKQLIQIEISTSHDGPWFLIMESPFAEDEIAQYFEKVANDLRLDITRGEISSFAESIILKNIQKNERPTKAAP